MLFVLVICVFMLNLVAINCYAMLNNYSKAIRLRGTHLLFWYINHPAISTGNTHPV